MLLTKENFSPLNYLNEGAVEKFDIPREISEVLPQSLSERLKKASARKESFLFRLDEYPGKANPVELKIYEERTIIFFGQMRQEEGGLMVKEGKGYLYKYGSLYSGYFQNDRFDGPGEYLTASPYMKLFGFWQADKVAGVGMLHSEEGMLYKGEFLESVQQGYGEELWADGSVFKGSFVEGMKSGYGELIWKDKATYKGSFKKNMFDGYGEYQTSDGNLYHGEWLEDMMHGKGKFSWKSGKYYQGDFKENKKEGRGVMVWENLERYEGNWKNGLQDGDGAFTDARGVTTSGIWRKGQRVDR